jgi:hypothetical protein
VGRGCSAPHTFIERMPSEQTQAKQPSADRHGLTVALDLTTGRASILEQPYAGSEVAEAAEQIARGDIKRMSSGR